MQSKLGYLLYACGRNGLPQQIPFAGNTYRLRTVLKHDFFAATALYESDGSPPTVRTSRHPRIVLKLSRQHHLLGLPLTWLGELLCCHEVSILAHLNHLRGTPRLLSRYGKTGFIYEYIEGCSLSEQKELPDDFFDRLSELLRQIHKHNVAYLDMDKRSNILVGPDGRPHLIDFQISLHIADRLLLSKGLANQLRRILQHADIYHLFKHKRHLCPELLKPPEKVLSRQTGGWIQAHRLVANPFKKLRRALLRFLYARGVLVAQEGASLSPEHGRPRFPQ
ncbi:MAG TPA: hypothetical protein VMW16_17050 [Sedimentisphaerales bacterium]|nr:hypothetical protein [Sedimentisphaerales bacterium]